MSTLDEENRPTTLLDNVTNQHDKALRVVLFMAYLYMHDGLRDEQIKKAVTSVTYMFETAGVDTSFVSLAVVARGRRASVRSNEECVEKENERTANVILPVCPSVTGLGEDNSEEL